MSVEQTIVSGELNFIMGRLSLNFQKVGNIQLILDSLNNHKTEADEGNSSSSDLLQFRPSSGPKANPKSLVNERRRSSKFRAIFRSTGFVKNLIPNNINDFEFIYEVNFNAGRVKLTFIRYILERKKCKIFILSSYLP